MKTIDKKITVKTIPSFFPEKIEHRAQKDAHIAHRASSKVHILHCFVLLFIVTLTINTLPMVSMNTLYTDFIRSKLIYTIELLPVGKLLSCAILFLCLTHGFHLKHLKMKSFVNCSKCKRK